MHSQVDRQNCSRLVMQNGSFIIKRSLTEKKIVNLQNKTLFCTLTQNTRQIFLFLPCQHRKNCGKGKGEEASIPFAKISGRKAQCNGKIKLKEAPLLLTPPRLPELAIFSLWELCTLCSLLLTHARNPTRRRWPHDQQACQGTLSWHPTKHRSLKVCTSRSHSSWANFIQPYL